MESTTHRHTVSVAELRRLLANAPTSGAQRPSLTTAFPSHNRRRSTTLSTANGRVPSSPTTSTTSSPSSSPGCSSPLSGMHPTPPASFDVRAAAEKCRAIEGYVSFMDVTGLGCPAGIQDDDEDAQAETHRRWSWDRWFSPSSPPTTVVHKQLGKP